MRIELKDKITLSIEGKELLVADKKEEIEFEQWALKYAKKLGKEFIKDGDFWKIGKYVEPKNDIVDMTINELSQKLNHLIHIFNQTPERIYMKQINELSFFLYERLK